MGVFYLSHRSVPEAWRTEEEQLETFSVSEIEKNQAHAHVSCRLQLLWTIIQRRCWEWKMEWFGCSGPQISLEVLKRLLKIRGILVTCHATQCLKIWDAQKWSQLEVKSTIFPISLLSDSALLHSLNMSKATSWNPVSTFLVGNKKQEKINTLAHYLKFGMDIVIQ